VPNTASAVVRSFLCHCSSLICCAARVAGKFFNNLERLLVRSGLYFMKGDGRTAAIKSILVRVLADDRGTCPIRCDPAAPDSRLPVDRSPRWRYPEQWRCIGRLPGPRQKAVDGVPDGISRLRHVFQPGHPIFPKTHSGSCHSQWISSLQSRPRPMMIGLPGNGRAGCAYAQSRRTRRLAHTTDL